jgi:hypothetical protein
LHLDGNPPHPLSGGHYMKARTLVGWTLALAALLLAACGGGSSAPAALPTPAGAAQGLNTFIFFYTDG